MKEVDQTLAYYRHHSDLIFDRTWGNHEPEAIERDRSVAEALAAAGIAFETRKDQVVFERREVLTGAGTVPQRVTLVTETPGEGLSGQWHGKSCGLAAPPAMTVT
jgi:deoxyribodipyrimidine photolyase